MVIILLECILVVFVVYMIFVLLFYKEMEEEETISPYECGFDPNSVTRVAFSYRFFLISILFLIFDVEISLMLPFPFLMGEMMSLWIFFSFVMILIVGLIYEYYQGSLEWMGTFVSKA